MMRRLGERLFMTALMVGGTLPLLADSPGKEYEGEDQGDNFEGEVEVVVVADSPETGTRVGREFVVRGRMYVHDYEGHDDPPAEADSGETDTNSDDPEGTDGSGGPETGTTETGTTGTGAGSEHDFVPFDMDAIDDIDVRVRREFEDRWTIEFSTSIVDTDVDEAGASYGIWELRLSAKDLKLFDQPRGTPFKLFMTFMGGYDNRAFTAEIADPLQLVVDFEVDR